MPSDDDLLTRDADAYDALSAAVDAAGDDDELAAYEGWQSTAARHLADSYGDDPDYCPPDYRFAEYR